jgi:hypothetical protein
MRKVFETPGDVMLVVRVPSGEVEIDTVEGSTTVVEVEARDEELLEAARIESHERQGAYEVVVDLQRPRFTVGLQLDRPRRLSLGFWRGDDFRVAISTPPGARIDFESGSAELRARGRLGTLEASSRSGDVLCEDITGDVEVKSASGDVALRSVGGRATVNTASGDVEIGRLGGVGRIRCASGDVEVGETESELTVQTASGDQEVRSVAEGAVTLQSASGDIEVGIRRGSRLWIDARSMSGEMSSELEVTDVPLEQEGPLVELRATAMSGDITVVRA